MSQFAPGASVRIYYEDDAFDEGEVTTSGDDGVVVDFYDWKERWPTAADFKRISLVLEGKTVWVPLRDGTIVEDFRRK